jgi:hypothetical protein
MNRIRRGAGLPDEQALLVAGSHLRGMAETWWTVHEDNVKTWKEFEALFALKFGYKRDMAYWEEIQDVRQGPNDSVEEVALKLKHLFGRVKTTNSTLMIRTLLKAIDPDVAQHVERNGLSNDYDDVAEKAATVDRVNRKYGGGSRDVGGSREVGDADSMATKYYSSVNNAAVKPDDIDELTKTIKDLTSVVAALKANQEPASKPKPKAPPICWNCNESGHAGKACPHPIKSKQEGQSGKDQERQ